MTLFDLPKTNRRAWVASLMGLSPNHPETWPNEMIDNIITSCESVAERELMHLINRACKDR